MPAPEGLFALKRDAAPGVDGLTWRDYETDLERNLDDLHEQVQRGAYRALPSRRRYIKADGRQRPLAVAALEGKIVQRAALVVLNGIYEEDFLGFSYGFRPKRSQHDALDALIVGISRKKMNDNFDADIRSFLIHNTAVTVTAIDEILGLCCVLPDHRRLAPVGLITPYAGLLAVQQVRQHGAVGDIGGCRHHRMD
jgi:retron-type reverse transcriptase